MKNNGGIGKHCCACCCSVVCAHSNAAGPFLGPSPHGWGGTWAARIIFDNLYNLILMVLMMNVLFGVILDTFGELREKAKDKEARVLLGTMGLEC